MAVLAPSVKRSSLILMPLCLFFVSVHALKAKKLHFYQADRMKQKAHEVSLQGLF